MIKARYFYLMVLTTLLFLSAMSSVEAAFNFTEFEDGIVDWFTKPYREYFGNFTWLIIFAAVIALVYGVSQNLPATVAAICITFAVYGGTEAMLGNPEYSLFFSIIAIAGIAGLVGSMFYLVKRS